MPGLNTKMQNKKMIQNDERLSTRREYYTCHRVEIWDGILAPDSPDAEQEGIQSFAYEDS